MAGSAPGCLSALRISADTSNDDLNDMIFAVGPLATPIPAALPLFSEGLGALRFGRFSNRPVGVKRFQTIHHHSVDVSRGLVLLFGIGTKALVWGFLSQEVYARL